MRGRRRCAWTPSLPPEMLSDVISRLPIRDAVRTSALSRAWRRRWESVPYLSFSWPRHTPPGAISAALRRYSGPIRKFSNLYIWDDDDDYDDEASFRHPDRWLLLLAGKGVQSLFLAFRRSDERDPYATFLYRLICCELTQLELADCCIPGLPTCFAGFPNLTSLRLSDVGFPEGAKVLEILLARSPLLKSLSLLMLFPAKNGVYDQLFRLQISRTFLLLDCMTMVGRSVISRPLRKQHSIGHYTPMTVILSSLLQGCLKQGCSILQCRNASKLETLRIKLFDDSTQDDEVDIDFLNGQWTDDLFSNLRSFYVRNMTCKLSEMHFIEFILSKARSLEKFDVCLAEECSKSNEEAVIELAKYRRASAQAKVSFSRVE